MPYSFVVWRRDRAFFIAIAKAVVFLCPRAERRKKMVEKIIEELRKVLGTEYSLRSEVVHRYNWLDLQLIIEKKESGKHFILSLNEYLITLESKSMSLDMVVDALKQKILQLKFPKELENVTNMRQKKFILANVQYQVVGTANNFYYLQDLVKKPFLDLTVVYRVFVGSESSYLLKTEFLKQAGISMEELDNAAYQNGIRTGHSMVPIERFLDPESDEKCGIYVFKRKSWSYGANILLFPDYLMQCANRLHDDIILLPSSIHECVGISYTYSKVIGTEALQALVKDINERVVEPEDILSDSIYMYKRLDNEVVLIS